LLGHILGLPQSQRTFTGSNANNSISHNGIQILLKGDIVPAFANCVLTLKISCLQIPVQAGTIKNNTVVNMWGFSRDFKKSWSIHIAAKAPPTETPSTKEFIGIALLLITPNSSL
jgi:hypothetical protein